jgi:hypothetical protein
VSFYLVEQPSPIDLKQGRLMQLAALFLLLFSITLTLSPAARLHPGRLPCTGITGLGSSPGCSAAPSFTARSFVVFPERDPFIFPVAALLTGWGLLTIWRLDSDMGLRQTIWLIVCQAVMAGDANPQPAGPAAAL